MSKEAEANSVQAKQDVLLMKKARSVIDAVLALNSLGSDDETGQSRVASPSTSDGKGGKESLPGSQAPAKPPSTLYWLADDLDDFNGLTFPQKMHHVLRKGADEEAIAWLPSGRSFVVRDQKKFATQVIPKYFGKNVAYTSFTRRLVRWGWQNIAKGTYFCKNFTREHPEQCLLMTYNAKVSNKSAAGGVDFDAPVSEEVEAAASMKKPSLKTDSPPPTKRRRESETLPFSSTSNFAAGGGVAAAASQREPMKHQFEKQMHQQYHQQQQILAQMQSQSQQQILARTQQFAQQAGLPLHALFPSLPLFNNGSLGASALNGFNARINSANVNIASSMFSNMDVAKRALSGSGEMMTPLKLELLKKQLEIDELKRKALIEEMNMRKALDAAIQAQRTRGQIPRPHVANNGGRSPHNSKKKGPSWVTDNARAA
jgi:hypothetical protein